MKSVVEHTIGLTGPILGQDTWLIEPASPAATELANTEAGPGGPWGERPVQTAYGVVRMGVLAITEHARAIANLLPFEPTPIQLEPLTRAAIEAGSEAWWLAEPAIGAGPRVRRVQLARYASAENLEQTVVALARTEPTSEFGETTAPVAADCTTLGIAVPTRVGRGALTCDTEQLPSYTRRARDFMAAVGATGLYSLYSGTAHAEIYAMFRAFHQSGQVGSEPRFALHGDLPLTHAAVHGALRALVGLVARCRELFGWTGPEVDDLIDYVDAEMQRLQP